MIINATSLNNKDNISELLKIEKGKFFYDVFTIQKNNF